MKYWLLVFFMTPDGEFIEKKEYPFKDKAACLIAKGKVKVEYIAEMVCVSNDHYTGKKQDENVPYDF